MSAFLDSLLTLELPLEKGASRHWIPNGDAGTAETIAQMRKLVDAGKRSPRVRELVGNLIQRCPKKDYYCYAETVFNFCRDKIQYAYDPHGVEWVETPERILDAKIADCDSICVLFASMCENLGLPCKFVTIRADKGRSNEFSHVYARVKIPGRGWIGADCTMQHDFGWEPTGYPEKEWNASNTAAGPDMIDGVGGFSGGLSGMRDFASENFEPMGNREVMIEEAVICADCPPVRPEPQAQSDFFFEKRPAQNFLTGLDGMGKSEMPRKRRKKFCRKFPAHPKCRRSEHWHGKALHGLGADTSPEVTLEKILDGTYGRELVALRRTQQLRNGDLFTMGTKTSDPAKKAKITAAAAANREALKATMEAIERYNKVVRYIQTATFGQLKPAFLSGMGILPAIASKLLVGGAIVVLLNAFSEAMLSLYGKERTAKGLFEQISGTIDSTANLIGNITIAAIVGVGIYFGAKFLRANRDTQTFSLAKVS
jgi:hypothetical protein